MKSERLVNQKDFAVKLFPAFSKPEIFSIILFLKLSGAKVRLNFLYLLRLPSVFQREDSSLL